MNDSSLVVEKVEDIYKWLEGQLQENEISCDACGKCCDFKNYDHRLYVTTPEMIYFRKKIDGKNIKPMTEGKCPYNIDGKCSVYKYRFAGCRIFNCKGDPDRQSKLSEKTIQKFKDLCDNSNTPYHYAELSKALGTNP